MATVTVNKIKEYFAECKEEGSLSDADILKCHSTLNYIRQLASMTQTNIAKWDIIKLFGVNEQGPLLISDKKEINKIFFAKLEKLAEKAPDMSSLDSITGLDEALQNAFNIFIRDRRSNVEYSINEQERAIMDYNNRLQTCIKKLTELQYQYDAMNNSDTMTSKVKEEINKVLQAGVWINPIIQPGDNSIYFNLAGNVVLKYVNRAAGLDIQKDFGQLAVRVGLGDMRMTVLPYKNNISFSRADRARYFHPHVAYDGHPCWGNALQSYQTMASQFKLSDALELLYSLLTSYNDSNPYVPIQSFANIDTKYTRPPEGLKHPDNVRTKRPDETEAAPANAYPSVTFQRADDVTVR